MFINVISHNFKGYDKMLMLGAKYFQDKKFKPLVESSEKPKCVEVKWSRKKTIHKIDKDYKKSLSYKCRFIDSCMHLQSSLEKLVEKQARYFTNEILSFSEYIKVTPINELRKLFPAMSIQFPDNIKFLCMLRKGVFPYDWFTSLDQLTYNKIIPFEEFYSKLKKSYITKEDYKHYTEVWDLHISNENIQRVFRTLSFNRCVITE